MIKRDYWLEIIENAWKHRSLIWLSGVRRAGKTVLAQSLSNVEYFDCELPSVRQQLEDPESFLSGLNKKRIVLDEIHRLRNPSEILKIAADHFSDTKVLATGSSTLQASSKFKDTLTGRKTEIWLTPMINADMVAFNNVDIRHRLLRGGLPSFFLSSAIPERDFQEWLDSFWSKDIQELFRLEKQYSFKKFVELIFTNSGSIFEATKYATPAEASRVTITNYLSVLEQTYIAYIIRPFSSRKATEIISAPKVYAFDTGFVCYYKGWFQLRNDDLGFLWEHFVLNEIQAKTQKRDIYYWRDKRGHELDFILIGKNKEPIVAECKWSVANFNPKNLKIFRKNYKKGQNFVIAQDVNRAFSRNYEGIKVSFVSLADFVKNLDSSSTLLAVGK